MEAYKLMSLKHGELYPLFINSTTAMPVGEWLEAEDHPTKGYAHRPGWHCLPETDAPHLKMEPKGKPQRVWVRVEIGGYETVQRPPSQGGEWYLANWMKIMEVV